MVCGVGALYDADRSAGEAAPSCLDNCNIIAPLAFRSPHLMQELSFAQLQLSETTAALKRACALTEAAEAAMQASAARASTAEASASAAIAQLSQSTVARMEETGELRNALQAQ